MLSESERQCKANHCKKLKNCAFQDRTGSEPNLSSIPNEITHQSRHDKGHERRSKDSDGCYVYERTTDKKAHRDGYKIRRKHLMENKAIILHHQPFPGGQYFYFLPLNVRGSFLIASQDSELLRFRTVRSNQQPFYFPSFVSIGEFPCDLISL